jgi:hypothetical protein
MRNIISLIINKSNNDDKLLDIEIFNYSELKIIIADN